VGHHTMTHKTRYRQPNYFLDLLVVVVEVVFGFGFAFDFLAADVVVAVVLDGLLTFPGLAAADPVFVFLAGAAFLVGTFLAVVEELFFGADFLETTVFLALVAALGATTTFFFSTGLVTFLTVLMSFLISPSLFNFTGPLGPFGCLKYPAATLRLRVRLNWESKFVPTG